MQGSANRLLRRFFSPAFDIGALALLAVLYALPVLVRSSDVLPLGGDADAVVSPYLFVRESLLAFQFPIWDPYYNMGRPYLADPLATYLNPVALLPVLALGVIPGIKIAIALSLFLAGLGTWTLGRVLHLPQSLCLWAAVLLMLSGNIAGKFSAGWFDYILSYPWIPFSMAFVFLALRNRRPHWIALASLSTSMLAFSGNYYFLLYAFIGGMTLTATEAILQRLEGQGWRSALTTVGLYGGIVALALGLAAVRLLPSLELLPRMFRIVDPFGGSQHPFGVLADFLLFPRRLYGEPSFVRLFGYGEGGWLWWEFYAFVGPVPFLGLAFLRRAWRQPEARRQVIVFGALGIVSLLVIANAYVYSPFHWIWQALPIVGGFRFPVRALVLTTCSLAVLSAIGFSFWRTQGWRTYLKAGVLGVGLLMVFVFNGYVIYADGPVEERGAHEAVAWLRQRDPGVYYVQILERAPGEVRWRIFAQYELVNAHIKILDAYYGWYLRDSPALWRVAPQGTASPPGAPGTLKVLPKYMMMPAGQGQAFSGQGYRVAATIGGFDILETDAALPYTFVLPAGANAEPGRIGAATTNTLEPGKIILTASAQTGDRLVALETFYPGWTVQVDEGAVAPATNYMGVLSKEASSGTHRYVFEYRPLWVRWGLAVSLATVALLLGLVIFGKKPKGALS